MSRKEREGLRAEFPGTRHWTGKTIEELIRAVDEEWADPIDRRLLWQIYDLDHRMNNLFLHHSAPGPHAGIQQRPGRRTFKSGPSWVNVKEAFASAFFSYSQTVSLVLQGATLDALNELYGRHIQTFTRKATSGNKGEQFPTA